ncbi:MAG TPA: tRNA lysidine(34) synthetase TilS [Chthoniobacterales bacterium]
MAAKPSNFREWPNTVAERFPPEKRYLVGVSGGRDSVALLHWLLSVGYSKLIVCHLNHQLRGRSASADARFVERLAANHALGYEPGEADVRAIAAETKQSLEAAGRMARYEFFARIARRRRCRVIFLGHHADDTVETFLINLFRGAGMQGLRGMQEVATRQIGNVELTIVRPLLGVSRSEIDGYVATHRLRFREDETNETLKPLRNRVRHRVLPMLEKEFGRDIRKIVRRTAVIAADEDALLASMLPTLPPRLRTKSLRALPIALQRRALAKWLRNERVRDVSFELVEEIRLMLESTTSPAKVNLPGDRHVRRRSGELFIEP